MTNLNEENIYSNFHLSYFDKIIINKRQEIINLINNFLIGRDLSDVLDVGTTEDDKNPSNNFIIKNLKGFSEYKSISDQKIDNKLYSKCLNKSICEEFLEEEINIYSSDLVISNATIEHVGSENNQIKMISNIIKLSKKIFIIITPNRNHPIEFHTKLPLIHWLPKKTHRFIISLLGFKFLAIEKNLNLLNQKNLEQYMKKLNFNSYKFKSINFLKIKSNIILIGEKN